MSNESIYMLKIKKIIIENRNVVFLSNFRFKQLGYLYFLPLQKYRYLDAIIIIEKNII